MKRGLRDATGRGVLTSLTRISEVKGYTVDGQDTIPCPGVLYYRGYDVRDLVQGALADKRFGFEEVFYLLREDKRFTDLEARALDAALILHADHGSNNSTFTNVVVASTGSDFFSTISASIGSLKGPRHGGANQRVVEMMADMQKEIGLEPSDEQLREILMRLLNRDFYDHAGLIYGIGHAIYTLSDPRAEIIRSYCERLAKEKGREKEYTFYVRFEKMAIQIIKEVKGIDACANVDLYSGFAYTMLNIPQELYTPLFVCSRICGWLAHNIENKLYDGRIMRPATRYVGELHDYVNMEERKDEDCYRI